MKKIIFCTKDIRMPRPLRLKCGRRCSAQDINRYGSCVVIVDYRCLARLSSFHPSKYIDKVFILYVDSKKIRDGLKMVKKYDLFDCFTDRTDKKELDIKFKKALEHLRLKRQLLKMKKTKDESQYIDPDLKCYSWKFFRSSAPQEIRNARQSNYPLSFIILDIDYFRQINEGYGYQAADFIIREFLKIVKRILPAHAYLVRFREDSFIIIAPSLIMKKAKALAEKIRSKVYTHNFKFKRIKINITVSVALVCFPENDFSNFRDVILALEKALEFSKEEGGNRVTVYSPHLNKRRLELKLKSTDKDIEPLKRKMRHLNKQFNETIIDMIYGFAKAIEVRDLSTAKHVEDVAYLAKRIARKLKLPLPQVEDIYHAAVLHDLGKIGIPPTILMKKQKLTKKDWEVIKTHPWIAAEILREIHILKGTLPAILYHHERWDGKGYPLGLKGEEIPLPARIVAIADVYEALISDRPYRKAFSKTKAIEIIKTEKGKYFEPKIVDVFLELIRKK